MPRKRGSEGVAAHLRGGILLTIFSGAVCLPETGEASAMPAVALADALHVAPSQARVAIRELLRARCLRVQTIAATSRRELSSYGRWYGPPRGEEEYGPGRRPRVYPVALVIEPDKAAIERCCTTLRADGILPVAVATSDEAVALLRHLAFEQVVMASSDEGTGIAPAEAIHIHRAAREAGCGGFLALGETANGTAALRASGEAGASVPLRQQVEPGVLAEGW